MSNLFEIVSEGYRAVTIVSFTVLMTLLFTRKVIQKFWKIKKKYEILFITFGFSAIGIMVKYFRIAQTPRNFFDSDLTVLAIMLIFYMGFMSNLVRTEGKLIDKIELVTAGVLIITLVFSAFGAIFNYLLIK